jgi:hypothetical protein
MVWTTLALVNSLILQKEPQCNAMPTVSLKNGINTCKYLTITITSNASQMIGFLQKKFTSRKTKELQFAVVRPLEYCSSACDPGNKNHKTKKSKKRAGLVPLYYIIHDWICSKILCYILYYTIQCHCGCLRNSMLYYYD